MKSSTRINDINLLPPVESQLSLKNSIFFVFNHSIITQGYGNTVKQFKSALIIRRRSLRKILQKYLINAQDYLMV